MYTLDINKFVCHMTNKNTIKSIFGNFYADTKFDWYLLTENNKQFDVIFLVLDIYFLLQNKSNH